MRAVASGRLLPAVQVLGALLLGVGCTASAPGGAPAASRPADAAASAGATVPAAAPATAGPRELATVKAGLLGSASDAGFYIAADKGFFREQGIELRYESVSTGGEMIPQLGTGQLDVSGPTINPALINAVVRGVEIKMVADKGSVSSRADAYTSFVLRKDLADSGAVREFRDLRGRTVALTPPKDATANAVDLSTALAKDGLTDDDVQVVNLTYQDMNAAFANRSIDAAIMFEPLITQGIGQNLLVLWRTMDEIFPFRQYTGVGYSPQFVSERHEVAQRFMVAYLQGVRAYYDAFHKGIDRPAIIETLVRHTTLKDPALYERIIPPGLNPDGAIGVENVRNDLQWFQAKGQVQGDFDLAQLIDNQYVEYALAQLGRYAR